MMKVSKFIHYVPEEVVGIQYNGNNFDEIKEFIGCDADITIKDYIYTENNVIYFRFQKSKPFKKLCIGDYLMCTEDFCYSIVSEKYFQENYFEIQK